MNISARLLDNQQANTEHRRVPRNIITAQGHVAETRRGRKKDDLITIINPLDELYKGKNWM